MLKPTYLNICISIFIKYLLFYILLMIINNDYKLLQINNIRNGGDLFYYLWIILFFPIVDLIIFSAPIYFSFKTNNRLKFTFKIIGILIIEYFLYAYFTSQNILSRDAVYKVIINSLLLILMFNKNIEYANQNENIS